MTKEKTNKEKFLHLKDLFSEIVPQIRKDLKQEHLKQDLQFLKKYFSGKSSNKLSNEELAAGYLAALEAEERAEELAEFMANRWVLKNSDLYYFFEKKLSEINPNFTELTQIDDASAEGILEEAKTLFGAINTYVFSVLNSVVFSPEALHSLKGQALLERSSKEEVSQQNEEKMSLGTLQRTYEEKIARLSDRYEKKILGLQKKYIQDTENLKKQVTKLQQRIAGCQT